MFKGKLVLDVKNRTYLTEEINYVFELNAELTRDAEAINDKRQPISQLPSSLIAMGIIFGDIGTSPLYILKQLLEHNQ